MKKRNIVCAFCGRQGRASTEHAIARWVHKHTVKHVGVTPARRRHKWGGTPTVRDVCTRCNNGPLSVLDDQARRIFERSIGAPPVLTVEQAGRLARWGAKVAFNAQRLCFAEGTQGEEPRMPVSAVRWILKGTSTDQVAVAASWVDESKAVRENFGVFGSNGTFLPRRYVQAGPVVIFVAWAHPKQPASTAIVHRKDCEHAPAVGISHPSSASVTLPVLADTSMLLKGLLSMPDIANELLRRLEKLSPQ